MNLQQGQTSHPGGVDRDVIWRPKRGGNRGSIGKQIMMAIMEIVMMTEAMMMEREGVDMKTIIDTQILQQQRDPLHPHSPLQVYSFHVAI